MVKAYQRYRFDGDFGVVASLDSNVCFNKRGDFIYTAQNEFMAIWNPKTSKLVNKLSVNDSSVISDWIPDSAEDGENTMQNGTGSANRLGPIPISCIRQSPTQHQIVAVGYIDGSIRLWDVDKKIILATFHGHKSKVAVIAFR